MKPLSRREAVAAALTFAAGVPARAASSQDELAQLEARVGGRLGVCALDLETGRSLTHRGGERFPMCSTFKILACGAVLARVDAGQESLSRRIVYSERDLVPYSPVTERRTGGDGLSLADLCEAAVTQSDNTAGNLILEALGGPPAMTAFARGLGDAVSRLDRNETSLNDATPGDPRDTTSPEAMAINLRKLVLEDALSPASRARLAGWLIDCRTGAARLRAGLPPDWRVGDKTGSGEFGTTNDVAVVWPSGRRPLIVTAYLTQTTAAVPERNAAIADVSRVVLRWMNASLP